MKSNRMRIAVLCGTVIAFTGAGFAQMDPGMPQQQQPGMQDSVGSSGMTGPQMRDRAFVLDAVSGGIAEVQMGQLALQKSSNDEIKKFGQMVVDDHTAMGKQMESVADSMSIRVIKKLDKAHQAEYDKLKALSGSNFDNAYLVYMFTDHRDEQHAYRVELVVVTDGPLKDQILADSPIIRRHLQAVTKIAEDLKITLPVRRPPPAK